LAEKTSALIADWSPDKVNDAVTEALNLAAKGLISLGAVWSTAQTKISAGLDVLIIPRGAKVKEAKRIERERLALEILGMSEEDFLTKTGQTRDYLEKLARSYDVPVINQNYAALSPTALNKLNPLFGRIGQDLQLIDDNGSAKPELEALVTSVAALGKDNAGAQAALIEDFRKKRQDAFASAEKTGQQSAEEVLNSKITEDQRKTKKQQKAELLAKLSRAQVAALVTADMINAAGHLVTNSENIPPKADMIAVMLNARARWIQANTGWSAVASAVDAKLVYANMSA